MSYDTGIEARVDELVRSWQTVFVKKHMFGGLAYMSGTKICFAVIGDELLLRIEPLQQTAYLNIVGVRPAVMGTRTMRNWLLAGSQAIETDRDIETLLAASYEYAASLPGEVSTDHT